jgi:cytochrome c-type biogenesis protein CcmH
MAEARAAAGGGAMPGPDAEQVAAASQMAPEDRQAMIRGMVEGLRDRLYDEGGSVDEWARLIRALGVLGDPEAVAEAFERGAQANAEDAAAVSFLRERALVAGATLE